MSKILFLHIGSGRCGSSAIQHFAAENRTALLRRGVCYPHPRDFGVKEPSAADAVPLSRNATKREALPRVVEYISQSSADRFLLSSEFLYSQSGVYLDRIRQAFAKRDVRVRCVVYVREQREWLISRYAQALKSKRWSIPLEDYLRASYRSATLDYAKRLGALSKVFSASDLLIRIYQRDMLSRGDVRLDLFETMEVSVSDLLVEPPTTNASPSVLEMETMRAVNLVIQQGFNHRHFLQLSHELSKGLGWEEPKGAYRLVPPKLLLEIKEYYRPRNADFQRLFFPEVKGELLQSGIPDHYEMLPGEERINERSIAMLLHYFMSLEKGSRVNSTPKNSDRTAAGRPRYVRRFLGL